MIDGTLHVHCLNIKLVVEMYIVIFMKLQSKYYDVRIEKRKFSQTSQTSPVFEVSLKYRFQ